MHNSTVKYPGSVQISEIIGNSVVVQWLGLRAFTAKGAGLICGWGTKVPEAVRHGHKKVINDIFAVDLFSYSILGFFPCNL